MDTEQLNKLKERVYKIAEEHGLVGETDTFYFGLIMSEMGEAIKAAQNGKYTNVKEYKIYIAKGLSPKVGFEEYIKNSIEDKIADIVIMLLDFAVMKGYELAITQQEHDIATNFLSTIDKYTLSGFFFYLIGFLFEAFDMGFLATGINNAICILSDCFKKITNSDEDLWWFVSKKMTYNELYGV